MSRLQAIENALSSINGAVFQELCDSFLALRNRNYTAFSRTGSQSGKQKTTTGTPDSFLILPSGKYIFVEHSTNITKGVKKLIEDVEKCIDTKKTGVPLDQIAEVILCINFNLKPVAIEKLRGVLVNTRIELTVYMLDSIALELHLHHRDLTRDYLGLPFDTGQIVSLEKFIAEYNSASKGISTPIDNTFLHREQELKELKEAIIQNDFIILTGSPGIGKTKLALEGINKFLSENLDYNAYCVSYKHHSLLEDLNQYFNPNKNYILFVDDANRIDAFSQITGFYRTVRKGRLKIIITVRDYAYQEIGVLCQEFNPKRIDLEKFTDEEIIDIIKSQPFEIINQDFHKEIIRIADGNVRLAIMTALLSKAKQNISVLHDVSDLFEKYFSTFIQDDGEFAKELNIKCLGLIAFFYTIPYKNREVTTSILINFEIDYSAFIGVIDKLDKLELVELQYEHVKIPEQNLATYFFYKCFIKDNLLSFETLLRKYFDTNSNRFKDCVIPANNTFGRNNVMDKLQPFLQNHWKEIKSNLDEAFKFLSSFWFYMQLETLEFIFNIIDALPTVTPLKYEVTYKNNDFSYNNNDVIELLGNFLRHTDNLKDVIELGFEYTKKMPEHLPEWINKIRGQLTFDREDQTHYRFKRQMDLFEVLLDGLNNKDSLITPVFYELSKTFLSFKFHQTRLGRGNSFYIYDFSIPNTETIQAFRKNIWSAIDSHFESNPNESFNLLCSYSNVSPDVIKEIMEFDTPFIIEIIKKHLKVSSFEHCRYVHDQIRWCKRNFVTHLDFDLLVKKFTNPTYEIFLKIDWNRLRGKEMYEYDDYRGFEKLKEREIRNSFVFHNKKDIKEFYKVFVYLKKLAQNEWNYNATLDYIIDENCINNFELGCFFLQRIIASNNEVEYFPEVVFRNHLSNTEKANRIWNIMQEQEFSRKSNWEFLFYEALDESLLNIEYVQALILTISNIKDSDRIPYISMERFLRFEPNLFQIILRMIVDKNEKEEGQLRVREDFFSKYFNQLGNDIELIKKAYLQQVRLYNYFDLERNGFLNILNRETKFLIEFINSLYSENTSRLSGVHKNLGFVWQVENIDGIIRDVFDFLIEKETYYGILESFANSFFRNLQGDPQERAKNFLLDYCRLNFFDADKMNIIVDIARHSMSQIFDEILLLFLSLSQDRKLFSKIYWRGSGTSGIGDVILADIEMADWLNILSIVEKSTVGIKIIPIKQYLNEKIEDCKRRGDWERQRRFLER